uniref:Uncharacterized protein n=1 Tax=Arundo donax TaxID=35708 RepID=A0A0A9EPL9_ARUDO
MFRRTCIEGTLPERYLALSADGLFHIWH